jgi:hypothetical protein
MTCPWVEGCAKFASPLHTTKDIISCHAMTVVTFNCQLHSNCAIQFCFLHLHCSLWSIQELLSSSYYCWHLCALLVFVLRCDFYLIHTLGTYAVRMGGNWSKMSPVVSFSTRNYVSFTVLHRENKIHTVHLALWHCICAISIFIQ